MTKHIQFVSTKSLTLRLISIAYNSSAHAIFSSTEATTHVHLLIAGFEPVLIEKIRHSDETHSITQHRISGSPINYYPLQFLSPSYLLQARRQRRALIYSSPTSSLSEFNQPSTIRQPIQLFQARRRRLEFLYSAQDSSSS